MILNQIADDIRHLILPRKSPWDDVRYSWIRNQRPTHKGQTGTWIVWKYFSDRNRVVRQSRSPQYDLLVDLDRVEVKLSCRNEDGSFKWLQIRPSDDFTHLALVAVDFDNIRGFLIPKDQIQGLKPQHLGHRGSMETTCLSVKPTEAWLRPYEIAVPPPPEPVAAPIRPTRRRATLWV